MASNTVYVGLKGHVAAVDKATGATLWKTKLKGGLVAGEPFVTLLVDDGKVYAHTYGELACLDGMTGQVLWRNELTGLGYDVASLAVEGKSSPASSAVATLRNVQTRGAAAASSSASAASS